MTIKTRNRLSTAFFAISATYFAIALILTLYQFFSKTLSIPQFYLKNVPEQKIITNNSSAVIILIFIVIAYVCVTTFSIKQSFEKTQATDMIFFLMFLFGFLCDTVRIFIPLLNCAKAYSDFLIAISNVVLFGKILAPLAIIFTVLLSGEDYRKSANQNCLIILITSLIFAKLIPINTAILLPNFATSFAYENLLRVFTIMIFIISVISLFINNKKNEYSQKSAVGLTFICAGYFIAANGYSILTAACASVFLLTGTHFYVSAIHRQYLWIN